MNVEILDDNSPEQEIDLTGGNVEPEQEPVEQPEVDLTGDEPEAEVEAEPEGEPEGEPEPEPEKEEPEPAEGDEEQAEYFFNGEQVEVEVPEEVSKALEEAGVTEKELLTQLFKKDGDFSLEEATRAKLDEKFGKTLVDGYLNMYKKTNESVLKDAALIKEESERTLQAQQTEFMETVGDVKGLEAIEAFVLDNFDDKQIAAYNTVMESDSHEQQLLLIQNLQARMELMDKVTNGDKNVKLIGDDSSSSPAGTPMDKGYLTNQEYLEMMDTDKYWSDNSFASQVDAARQAGINKGI